MISFDAFSGLHREYAVGDRQPDWELLVKHDLLRDKPEMPWRDRYYRLWRGILAALHLCPPYASKYDWSAALKHAPSQENSGVLLLWAVGFSQEDIRRACNRVKQENIFSDDLLPVLLTNIADFSFYSRLGWQVEYLPELSGDGESYALRKCAYLAWRYRQASLISLDEFLRPQRTDVI